MKFFAPPEIEEAIQRSHNRSKLYGVDPNLDGAPESSRLLPSQLEKRISRQQDFFSLAKEQINTLYGLLKETGFCMALADVDGYVLYVVGDPDLIEHFKRRRCLPGYRWTEQDLGTCAIGLALVERIPIFLPGDKMYSALAQSISNAGSPVFGVNNDLLGVISLSGRSERMHIHTLGLVQQAAETVRARLGEREKARELAISNQYMESLFESDHRGMIRVDNAGCIIKSNKKAEILLNLPKKNKGIFIEEYISGDIKIKDKLCKGKGFNTREITSIKGIKHFASFDIIYIDNKKVVGGLLTIFGKKETMRMAVEITGMEARFTFSSIIGKSKKIQDTIKIAHIASGSEAPVFITGETGTGKELFAQAIHNASSRCNKPFVAINCGAIPKELLESELFGYEEGAFTGAQKSGRPGKFELADTGTLFLDEIGDMPFDMQVKLLRVLQSGEIQRVGGLRTISVDLRIIAASNKNLKECIAQHRFRADLYYRISTFEISIPALRERGHDVLLLAKHFIACNAKFLNRPDLPLKSDTVRSLLAYSWPGNVRQLESAIERASHIAKNKEIRPEHLGIQAECHGGSAGISLRTVAEVEREAIVHTLRALHGNIRQSASSLGLSRPTLYRKIKEYGLDHINLKKKM